MPDMPVDLHDNDERLARLDLMMKALSAHADELHQLAAAARDETHRGIANGLGNDVSTAWPSARPRSARR
jgi:hypothetical protein